MDEQGDVGPVSLYVSESTMSVTVPSSDETLIGNLGSEGKVEEGTYNEGEGGEIMVEVVGADVFVDGVGGRDEGLGKEGLGKEMEMKSFDNEGDFGEKQVEDLEGQVWDGRSESESFEDIARSSGERVEHVFDMEKVKVVSGLSNEQTRVVSVDEVEVGVSEEIVDGGVVEQNVLRDVEPYGAGGIALDGFTAERVAVLDDEVRNPGIESVNVSFLLMTEPTSAHTQFIGEEAAVAVRDEDSSSRDEALGDKVANVSLPLLGEDQSLVIETVNEATGKDNINQEGAESSDIPAAAAALMQVEGVNKEEILHSDTAIVQDDIFQDTGSNGIHEDVKEGAFAVCCTSIESIEQAQISSSHPVVVNLQTVNQISGGVEYLASEGRQLFAPNHTTGCIEDRELTPKAESKPKNDVVVCAESEISRYQTQVVDEKEISLVDSKESGSSREDISSDDKDKTFYHQEDSYGVKAETTFERVNVQLTNPESSHKLSFVAERSEGMVTEIEELLDFKDKAPGGNTPDGKLGYSENDEDMKTVKLDESSENDVAQRHIVFHSEPTCDADGGSVTVLEEDEVLKFEVEADVKDSHAIAINIQFDATNTLTSSDRDLSENTGTSAEHTLAAEGETEVTDDKNTSSVVEVLGRDASLQNDEKLNTQHFSGLAGKGAVGAEIAASLGEHVDTETQKKTLVETDGTVKVPARDISDDIDMSLLANEENLNGEIVGMSAAQHGVVGSVSALVSEAGLYDTTCPGENSVVGEQIIEEAKKQEVVEQQDETLLQMMDPGQSKDPVMSTDAVPVSNVDASVEGNFFSCSPEGNMHVSGNDVSPQDGERSLENLTPGVVNSNEPVNKVAEAEDESCKTNDKHIVHVDATEGDFIDVQQVVEIGKRYPACDQIDNSVEGIGDDEHSPEKELSKLLNDKTIKLESSFKLHQSGYLLPPENEGQFSVSDLVWGKVRSHPWWPGQIFDPADASEKAVKYFKKDCFLVAYFGDRTFAWSDASVLKPFSAHFSQIEKQSNSEAFQNAISSALAEVSRRVELGLACSCIPKDVHANIEYQIVENTGIREELSKQYGKDKSSGATSFEPDKLVDYVRGLAQSPSDGMDRLNLVIARAQLLAFCRYKGYHPPPEFVCSGEVGESNADLVDHEIKGEQDLSSKSTSHKRKHNLMDCLQPKKKEKSLSELMGDMAHSADDDDDSDGKALSEPVSSSLGRKRKAVDSLADGSDKRVSIYAAKVSTTTSTFPKPSFKIGDCISRVAGQLTGSASFKSNSEQPGNNVSPQISEISPRGSMVVSTEFSSIDEMLLQLQSLAQNPRKGYVFLNDIITFFSCFRNSVASGRRPNSLGGRPGSGRKRKISQAIGGATEEFEFDDANDSYWTDRIVQDYPEEQLLQNGVNEGGEHQLMDYDPDRSLKSSRRPHSKKRYSSGNHKMVGEELTGNIDKKMQELSPAELVLNFAECSLPSEMDLNKIFRRFGPLKESETEVHHESHRAKVVFKRGSDAEVAYSSAGMFNIFGSMPVTYQLSYSPSSSFKALPPVIS